MSRLENNTLEWIISNLVRKAYSNVLIDKHIPNELQNIILLFSQKIIGCDLLTGNEDLEFYKLLTAKMQISAETLSFTTLYKASDNHYSNASFHELCDGHAPTVTIIKSTDGNIFGGYTTKPWASNECFVTDNNAFLFLIKSNDSKQQNQCPQAFDIKRIESGTAILGTEERGPVFGGGYDISIGTDCNDELPDDKSLASSKKHSYTWVDCDASYDYGVDYFNLSGSDYKRDGGFLGRVFFQVIDYFVIKINSQ